jgi:hypothetical protein
MNRVHLNTAGAKPRPLILCALVLGACVVGAQAKPESVTLKDVAGITIGMDLFQVRDKMNAIGSTSNLGEFNARRSLKEAWTLKETQFKTIAYKASEKKGINWVTGWVREGSEIPFSSLGDLKSAARSTDVQAIWNVSSPSGNFRLVAKGTNGKASVISLFSLETRKPG